MTFDPATRIQDYLVFGEFGDVNPSITDSSTYTFLRPETMAELFDHEIKGCYLYSRHINPSDQHLADALARMEDGEAAQVMASGMGAISTTLLALCSQGDEIVASRMVYGGTYALLKNVLPRFGIVTKFVDVTNAAAVEKAMSSRTKVLYCETLSNPLLEVSDLPALALIAHARGAKLVVDNTFSPMMVSPLRHGADVVCHSMTKFINGTSDCIAGCVVSTKEFVDDLNNVNHGTSMLLGPVLDSFRAASILKNLHSLHIRMRQHGENALLGSTPAEVADWLARVAEEEALRRRIGEVGRRTFVPIGRNCLLSELSLSFEKKRNHLPIAAPSTSHACDDTISKPQTAVSSESTYTAKLSRELHEQDGVPRKRLPPASRRLSPRSPRQAVNSATPALRHNLLQT